MFNSPTKGKRKQLELIEDIAQFIEEDPQSAYHLIIGSDSHMRNTKLTEDLQ